MPATTDKTVPELTTFRWSSSAETDRFPVEDPATGRVIAVIQGGGPDQVDTAVEAAHRAFETDWRWRTSAERAAFLNTVLPSDVLHLLPGTGQRVGQPLTGHPQVRLLSFTGSIGAGAAVAATAARNMTPGIMELGGKDALVVFDDADLDRAVRNALEGASSRSTRPCCSTATCSSANLASAGNPAGFQGQGPRIRYRQLP